MEGEGDVKDPGKYMGITSQSHVMKVLERILDGRTRQRMEMEIGEEQQGIRKDRGTKDVMFTLRQLVKKRWEVKGEMAFGFLDLEKAYETVVREMVMVTLRLMGVLEAEVRLVEGLYKGTKGRVLVGPGMCEEFSLKIGLRQGSALSPLMFIMVMELVSRKVSLRSSMGKMPHADDLAVVAESGEEMQEVLTGGVEGSIWKGWAEDEDGED